MLQLIKNNVTIVIINDLPILLQCYTFVLIYNNRVGGRRRFGKTRLFMVLNSAPWCMIVWCRDNSHVRIKNACIRIQALGLDWVIDYLLAL